ALSDPTWERRPQPVYQTTAARVVVLALSRSMNATDLKPSRLVRARYKVEDVLALSAEGQTGLVAYAGDAFTVSPLTRDINTMRALLKVLDPQIMPADGGRADLGLLKAGELLRQAGTSNAQVLLIADGIRADDLAPSERAAARLRQEGYRVSILGVGTENGAPLTDAEGEVLRDPAGRIVVSRLDSTMLQSLASAGGGKYRSISDSGEALSALLSEGQAQRAQGTTQKDATTQEWKGQGALLAALLLPLAALAFRRNWLLCLVLLAGLASPPQPVMAATWNDLWSRPDQRAAKALVAGDYATASQLASDPDRRGSAEYKRGNYQQALDNFSRATGADADYNRGNTLARLGRYQDAIAAYDKSLKENPGSEDARVNKAAVEALLKQQQQQQNSNSQDDKSQKNQVQDKSGGQNSAQGKAQNQSPQQGDKGQASASSDQAPQAANANKADERPQNGEPSREHGKKNPAQDATSGKGGKQPEQKTSDKAQQQENQFADAAKKLAEHGAAAKAGKDQSANAEPAGNAKDQSQAKATRHPQTGSAIGAAPLDSEEKMAAEQWLRRIPDDPGGLLRRKFLYQYQQRAQHESTPEH
ncbi:MAG: VWA domain-containing protein, partial [Betaproteobacteria bacterium]